MTLRRVEAFIGALLDTLILVVALVVLNLVIGLILAWSVGPEKAFCGK